MQKKKKSILGRPNLATPDAIILRDVNAFQKSRAYSSICLIFAAEIPAFKTDVGRKTF